VAPSQGFTPLALAVDGGQSLSHYGLFVPNARCVGGKALTRSRRSAEGKYLPLSSIEPRSSNPQPVNYRLIIIVHYILRQENKQVLSYYSAEEYVFWDALVWRGNNLLTFGRNLLPPPLGQRSFDSVGQPFIAQGPFENL